MSVIPCAKNAQLTKLIVEYAETLKTEAHKIGTHGLDENDFYNSGLFRGAIERVRGQFSATMKPKRDFVRLVLNHMQDKGAIKDWTSSGSENRHDYTITLPTGRIAVIELKGCLDGNNTNIFERPAHAQEFILWSICTNLGADPRRNAWSGVHTRLSAEIISREQRVDGLIIWDMVCGTIGRPCPKCPADGSRLTDVGQFKLPPPCLYLFPATIPSARNNPKPRPQPIADVQIMKAFHNTFGGADSELNSVTIEVANRGSDTLRSTTIERDNAVQQKSKAIAIRRK